MMHLLFFLSLGIVFSKLITTSAQNITVSCSNNNTYTITFGSVVIYKKDCSDNGEICNEESGCEVPEVSFLCPTGASRNVTFSKLGNCKNYMNCTLVSAQPRAIEELCSSGYLYHPVLRRCVAENIFNRDTTCYSGKRSCTKQEDGPYKVPHPYDRYVYIVCLNKTVSFTGGCTFGYDFISKECMVP